jgi:hypothetical protein
MTDLEQRLRDALRESRPIAATLGPPAVMQRLRAARRRRALAATLSVAVVLAGAGLAAAVGVGRTSGGIRPAPVQTAAAGPVAVPTAGAVPGPGAVGPYPAPSAGAAVPVANPSPQTYGATVLSISGSGPDDIWATGGYPTRADPGGSLTLHYNGTSWTQVAAPDAGQLSSVAAISRDDAWAVPGDNSRGRVLRWDGRSWKDGRLPATPDLTTLGVAGSGPDDAWIVGWQGGASLPGDSIGTRTLALHWNGSTWTATRTPNLSRRYNMLDAVLAVSATDAWAVGQYGNDRCLTMHWNGAAWTSVPLPDSAGWDCDQLTGIAQLGGAGIWAVGHGQSGGFEHNIYLHWTGREWVKQGTPPLSNTGAPSAISGTSLADAWAVGDISTDAILARYVSGRWRYYASSRSPLLKDVFQVTGIVTYSASDAWAVGPSTSSSTSSATVDSVTAVVLHWNGHKWQRVPITGLSPSPG